MEMEGTGELIWFGVAAVPVIIALVELVKRSFHLDSRWAALAAVIFGLLGGAAVHLAHETDHTLAQALFGGLLAGLSAAGLYSGVKAATHNE